MTGWEPLLSDAWMSPRWLRAAQITRLIAGGLAALEGLLVLTAWLVPALADRFPDGWQRMQPNTAASVILLAVAVLLFNRRPRISMAASGVATMLAVSALFAHRRGESSPVELALRVSDPDTADGLMSVQSATWIVAFAVTVAAGQVNRLQGITSALTMAVLGYTSFLAAGHMLKTWNLLGQSTEVLNSTQTMVASALLVAAWAATWAIHGQWRATLEFGVVASALRWIVAGLSVILIITGIAWEVMLAQGIGFSEATAISLSFLLVCGLIGAGVLFREMRQLESEIHRSATIDQTTGLLNQDAYWQLSGVLIDGALRDGRTVTSIVCDINDLKPINDTHGHAAGTALLATFGHCLRSVTPTGDLAARIGGDEFAVLLTGTKTADELIAELNTCLRASEHTLPAPVKYAYGCATTDDSAANLDLLTKLADIEMYKHKQASKASDAPRV